MTDAKLAEWLPRHMWRDIGLWVAVRMAIDGYPGKGATDADREAWALNQLAAIADAINARMAKVDNTRRKCACRAGDKPGQRDDGKATCQCGINRADAIPAKRG